MQLNKTSLVFALLILSFITLNAQDYFSISGDNQAKYIYRVAEDSLKNYFNDELNLNVNYNNLTFGMSFKANLPKYNQYEAIDELRPSQISYQWDERFLSYDKDQYFLQAGTIEEAFGSGITLRAWNDKDNDRDKRLDGALIRYTPEYVNLKIVYGALRNDITEQQIFKNDIVTGVDAEVNALPGLKLGAGVTQYKQKEATTSYLAYNHRNIYSGRGSFLNNLLSISTEYAEIRYEHNVPKTHRGHAFYNSNSLFLENITLNIGYKKYYNFNYNMSDLPALNHYDQLLSSIANIKTEEGLSGDISYSPNFSNEINMHYSEAWNENFKIRFANAFAEYKYNADDYGIQAEYEQIETKNQPANSWEKEMHPGVTFDFYSFAFPLTVKGKWGVKQQTHGEDEITLQQPFIQADIKLNDLFAFSIISEFEFNDDKSETWVGGELKTNIGDHSELKIFAGKEKGGKVCRNGVCKYQTPFEGIRLELSTNF